MQLRAAAVIAALVLFVACAPRVPPMKPITGRVPIPGPFDAAAPMVSAGSIVVEEGAEGAPVVLARDEMKNVPAMGDVPAGRFMAAMLALEGAIGAKCVDCHPDENYESDKFLPKRRSRQMIQMSVAINENWFEKQARVTCFTCHRGKWTPEQDPPLADKMRAPKVPVDLAAKSEEKASKVFKNIQVFKEEKAGAVLERMSLWTAALGVQCDYCHFEEGKWERDDVVQKQVTREMVVLTDKINETWFAGTPVMTCWSCHRGEQIPARLPPEGDLPMAVPTIPPKKT